MPQQLCTPQQGGYMMPQQGGYMPQQAGYMPQQGGYMPQQLCTPQQGGYMPQQLCTPQQGGYMPQQPYMPQQQMGMPPIAGGSVPYMAFPTDKPIENPNLIKINEPKLGAVTRSPEDALDVVLSGIFPEGYDKQAGLFEQGLDSFKVMQIVTRAGEEGYRIHMQDIMKDPTFKGIVAAMKTE